MIFAFQIWLLVLVAPCKRDVSGSVKLLSWWCYLAAAVVFEVLFGIMEVQSLPNAVE